MATILQTSDFAGGEYKIPNQEEVDLSTFITTNQARILKQLLGITFYNAFIAGLEAGEVAAKWTALKNGGEYTFATITYKYEGIIDLIKPRIFSDWIAYRTEKLTSAGVITPDPTNAKMSGPARIIGKYNAEYFRKLGDAWDHKNNLYGFLYANRETYTEWEESEWCPRGRVNSLGL